jgi:hypothetical protein
VSKRTNNRYYSNAYGRFMTPDPASSSANANDPQSWNRYAYAGGDPTNSNDPTGLDFELTCDGGDGSDNDSDCGGGGVMLTTGFTDGDIQGYYCSDKTTGQPTPCTLSDGSANPNAVVTAIGPDDASYAATTVTSLFDSVASLFGYDPDIPLPSCFGIFLNGTLNNLNPFMPGASDAAQQGFTAASWAAFNQALNYAATTHSIRPASPVLVYPFKSSIFRGILSKSAKFADAGYWGAIITAELQGLWAEIQAVAQAECQ